MAVKKTTTAKKSTATASRTKAAKTTTAKKATTKAKAANVGKGGTAVKQANAKKATAAPIKLTDKQLDLLKTVHGTKEKGYLADKKGEAKTLDALATKKLIKKGAKDKVSGVVRYHVSKAGEKHVSSISPSA
jgi:hypothetical protein